MNIWDSVHRGLEKASHEAARIARVQRLRASIDTLNRQIYTQQGTLIAKTMEIFRQGQITQGELLTICQELASLQQQLEQAQNELRQPHNLGPAAPATPISESGGDTQVATPSPPVYPTYPGQMPPPPPEYPAYATTIIPTPPPPPDLDAMETKALEDAMLPIAAGQHTCSQCGSTAPISQAYCQNCGTLLGHNEDAHLPTVRASNNEMKDPVAEEHNAKDGGN